MQCATCGNDNPPEARFCANCGTPLAEIALVSPSPDPPPPSEQVAQAPAAAVEYADFAVRTGAWLIDLVIIIAIDSALVVWGISSGVTGSGSAMDAMVGFAFLTTPGLYPWLFTGLRGQTPGKMVTGIMVVDKQGKLPGLWRAALRELLGKLISALALFIGFLWIAWDPCKQGWHDKLAGTYVVRRSRRP